MATISLVLNALNNASKGLLAVGASADAAADRVDALNAKIDATSAALGAQSAAAAAAAEKLNLLAASAATAAAAQDSLAAKVAAGGAAAGTASYGWGRLAGSVGLFGGLLSISVWHAVIDAAIEFGTTLLEAATAVVAFGAFAAPTFQHIAVQMQGVWTASNALNGAIYPLQASFSSLAKSVQPEAYELFGEALVGINQHAGEFAKLASSAGLTLDQLGARLVAAVDNGNSFNSFLGHANSSLQTWGDIIGNVGGILGNFFKVLPGYAYLLTDALKGVTGALEAVTSNGAVQWFMNAGLAIHGFLLWAGLAVTALLALRGPLTALGGWLLSGAQEVVAFGKALKGVQGAAAVADTAIGSLLLNPWTWLVVGVALLTGFTVALLSSKDAAQQFNASMQQLVQNSSLPALGATITAAIKASQTQLAGATSQVNTQLAKQAQLMQETAGRTAGLSGQLAVAKASEDNAAAGLQQLSQQQQLVTSRTAALSKEYGGNTNAMGLMIEAGITSAQITSKNAETWKAAKVQIAGVADANQAMALGAGRSAAAMNALNYAGDTTSNVLGSLDVDMQKVVTGMDQITSVVLGGEQALYSFATGLEQFQTDAAATGAVLGQVTTAQGKLSAASITLGSDYYSTMLPAMQKTIDAMELQLPTTAQLTAATGDMAAQLYPVAKGNAAAEASLMSLINGALGPGTVSFQNLQGWITKNGGSLQQLNTIMGQTTTQASVLANTLTSDLNAGFASDLLKVTGAQQALSQYTSDLVSNTQNTAAGQSDRAKLITDLENAGLTAQQAATYVGDLATNLGKVQSPPPVNLAVKVTFTALGSNVAMQAFNAAGALTSQSVFTQTAFGIVGHGAAGGSVYGPGGPTADMVPAMLSAGEYVVRASSVDKYGKGVLDAINSQRFATGGLATAYDHFAATFPAALRGYADGGSVDPAPFSLAGAMTAPMTTSRGLAGGVTINVEELVVRSDADLNMISQRLSHAVVAASMAAGIR